MNNDGKAKPTVIVTRPRTASEDSLTLKTPRTARFAEATTVYSPIEATTRSQNPFADPPTNHYYPQSQPADVGFGYLKEQHVSVEMEETDPKYLPPPTPGMDPLRSPLKSAMKSPGAAPRNLSTILSPTFREEQILEKEEEKTEVEQERDLVSLFASKLDMYLLMIRRNRKRECGWPSSSYGASTSAAVSSSLPCSQQYSTSSTQQNTFPRETTSRHGRITQARGRKSCSSLLPASRSSCASLSFTATGEAATEERRRLRFTTPPSLSFSSSLASSCG
jgi:hypothetical protein